MQSGHLICEELRRSKELPETLSSSLYFLLPQTLWNIWQVLSSLSIRLHRVSRYTFFPGKDATDVLTRWSALLLPSAMCCSLFHLLYPLFSRTGVVLSYLIYSRHRSPRFQLRNLCFLVSLSVFFLVFAAMDTAFCYTLVSLELLESRILHAAPAIFEATARVMSFCAVQLWTLCAARSSLIPCLYDLWFRPWKVSRFLRGSMVFCHAQIPRKGSGNSNNNCNNSKNCLRHKQ